MRIKRASILSGALIISAVLFLSAPSIFRRALSTPVSNKQAISNIVISKTPAEYITNPIRSDGFGAQFQTIIYAAIFAELNNLKFIYTPFTAMEHNYDKDASFLAKKEALINFIDNFEIAKDHKNIMPPDFWKWNDCFQKNIEIIANLESFKKIKTLFRSNKPKNFLTIIN